MVQHPMLSKGKYMPGIIHPYTSKTEKPTVPIKKIIGVTHTLFSTYEKVLNCLLLLSHSK